jgi:hypothetical protein
VCRVVEHDRTAICYIQHPNKSFGESGMALSVKVILISLNFCQNKKQLRFKYIPSIIY